MHAGVAHVRYTALASDSHDPFLGVINIVAIHAAVGHTTRYEITWSLLARGGQGCRCTQQVD